MGLGGWGVGGVGGLGLEGKGGGVEINDIMLHVVPSKVKLYLRDYQFEKTFYCVGKHLMDHTPDSKKSAFD